MRLTALTSLLLLALPAFAADAAPARDAAPADPPRTLLRGLDCLDPDFVRGWHVVKDGSLFVDAGRRKYRMRVDPTCVELGHSAGIRFRNGGVGGRICGNIGDAVQVRGRTCRIDRIELIDAEAWREAQGQGRTTVEAGTTL